MFFNDIEISNFRGFDNLKINGLSKLNVFVGANNVGKTSILESAFILTGMSNPLMPTRINYWRQLAANGMDSVKYLFHNIDFKSEPTLTAKCGNQVRRMTMRPVMLITTHYLDCLLGLKSALSENDGMCNFCCPSWKNQ